jgi:probable phosphoglycerate mutase
MTRIILVRHGQTAWNQIERFRGRMDVPLNSNGLWQADQTGKWIHSKWQVDAIYSSPLSRASATAEAIARQCHLPVRVHDDLTDFHYGDWQGKTPAEVQEIWPDLYAAWLTQPGTVQLPGGETLEILRFRTMRGVQEIISCHPQETVVLVGHTIVNRAILLGVLRLENDQIWQLGQSNCAINWIDWADEKFTLVSMNETGHLFANQTRRK